MTSSAIAGNITSRRLTWDSVRDFRSHPTLKDQSFAYETKVKERPNFEELQPGDSVSFSPPKPGKTVPANADRLTFSNGGTIEDKPDEEGLILTTPEGEKKELQAYGYVQGAVERSSPTPDLPTVHIKVNEGGEHVTWEQSFPDGGGTTLRPLASGWESSDFEGEFTILPNGETQVEAPEYRHTSFRREGNALVINQNGTAVAVAPPVPIGWLLSK